MIPPLFSPGQEVVSLISAKGLTPGGQPCAIQKGKIYEVGYLKPDTWEKDGWLCFLVGLDGWPEKYFAPVEYASSKAIMQLIEDSLLVVA